MTALSDLTTLADIQRVAEESLPNHVRTMLAGGFNDETTFTRTERALKSIVLRPRRLPGTPTVDCSTTLLGTSMSMPVLPAPAAPHFACHPDAEVAVTRGATRSGLIPLVPQMGHWSYADSAAATSSPLWAQAFFLTDRGQMRDLLQELEDGGRFKALVMTVDSPSMNGRREQELRLPTVGVDLSDQAAVDVSNVLENVYERMSGTDIGQSWEYLDWIRSTTSLPLVLKGVLRADVAATAVDHGIDGIVVSSHGSRLFDGQVTSTDVLAEIADAVGDRLEILYDGGIRTGADVVKVLALGARAVLIGRPIFWGLAAGGEDAIHRTFEILREELSDALRMIGRSSVSEVSRDDVRILRSTLAP